MPRRLAALLAAAALAAPALARAAPTPEEREAKARAWFTDTELLDQDAKERRFFEDVLRGNVVLVAFIFTRCFEVCPITTQRMNAIRKDLGDRFGKDVKFVSMSVDAERDMPADLARFAAKHQAVHPAWTYLTGGKEAMASVLKRLGQVVEEPSDHWAGFIAGNVRTGHWTRLRPDMPPLAVAETLRRLADEDAAPAPVSAAPAPAPAAAPAPPAAVVPATSAEGK